MKKLILTLSLSIFFVLSSFGQRNYAQELIGLLQQGRCFEAKEFRTQNADKLPVNDKAFDAIYNAHMALFFNQPDRAALYLEDLLTAYQFKMGPAISVYYGKLLMIYESQQRFNVAMGLCDQYVGYLKRNPFDMDGKFIQNEIKAIQDIKDIFRHKNAEARIKIERDTSGREEPTRISDSKYLRFNAKYNNLTELTWFDTGASPYFMMTRSAANKIGTKLVNRSKDSTLNIKGVQKRARVEVVDSITVGNARLFNIPVLVFDERFVPFIPDSLNVKPKSSTEKNIGDRQVVMGISAMKLLGRIEFDLEKRTVSFPYSPGKRRSNDSSNVYFVDNNLYLKLQIDGVNYAGYLNTGSDYALNMTSAFYEKYKTQIGSGGTAQEKRPVQHAINGDSFTNVHLDAGLINKKNSDVCVSDRKTAVNVLDGIVGVNLFKRSGSKVVFDFDSMTVKVTD